MWPVNDPIDLTIAILARYIAIKPDLEEGWI